MLKVKTRNILRLVSDEMGTITGKSKVALLLSHSRFFIRCQKPDNGKLRVFIRISKL